MTTARTASEWAAPRSPEIAEETVGGLLRRQAARRPDATALVATRHDGTPGRWSYAELLDAAERVAGGLLALAEPGERVALWAPNSPGRVRLGHRGGGHPARSPTSWPSTAWPGSRRRRCRCAGSSSTTSPTPRPERCRSTCSESS